MPLVPLDWIIVKCCFLPAQTVVLKTLQLVYLPQSLSILLLHVLSWWCWFLLQMLLLFFSVLYDRQRSGAVLNTDNWHFTANVQLDLGSAVLFCAFYTISVSGWITPVPSHSPQNMLFRQTGNAFKTRSNRGNLSTGKMVSTGWQQNWLLALNYGVCSSCKLINKLAYIPKNNNSLFSVLEHNRSHSSEQHVCLQSPGGMWELLD